MTILLDPALQQAAAPVLQPVLPNPAVPDDPSQGAPGVGLTPGGIQPATNVLPFTQRLAAHADSLTPPPGANAPEKTGDWARRLVGAAVKSFQTGGGFTDAATASRVPLIPGQSGALAGIENTLAARRQRLDAQKQAQSEQEKNNAITLNEQAQMYHSQKLTHQLDEDDINKSIANGQNVVKLVTSGQAAAPMIATDVPYSKIQTMLAQNQLNPEEVHAQPTKRIQTGEYQANDPGVKSGEHKTGDPQYTTLYTIYGDQPDVRADQNFADRYNSIHPNDAQPMQPGTVIPGKIFNSLEQSISDSEAATAARDKTLRDNKIQADKDSKAEEVVNIGPEWNNALAHAGNDPLNALKAMQQNPDIVKKYPNLYNDVRESYGPTGFDKLVENQQKLQNEHADVLNKLENDPNETAGDKAPAVIAMAQARLQDPNTPVGDRVRWQSIGRQAALATKITEDNKAAQSKIAEAAKDGDPHAAGQLLYDGTVAPQQIISSRKPEFATAAIKAAADIAKSKGETWTAQLADAQFKTASSPTNLAFFGSANSLLDQGGTLDQLAKRGAQIPQGSIPYGNKIDDWRKAQSGNGPMAGFAATALGVADDYSKVMGGGSGSDTSRSEALGIIAAAQSPDQRAQAIQSIRDQVTSQKDSRIGNNRTMRNMYGGTSGQVQATPVAQTVQPGQFAVVDPRGVQHIFPSQDAANKFKNLAGIK